jgi:hypothetical protein
MGFITPPQSIPLWILISYKHYFSILVKNNLLSFPVLEILLHEDLALFPILVKPFNNCGAHLPFWEMPLHKDLALFPILEKPLNNCETHLPILEIRFHKDFALFPFSETQNCSNFKVFSF